MIETSQSPSSDADIRLAPASDLTPEALQNDRVILSLPLPHRAVFYPLGFAVEVVTNEEAVLAIVDECWGGLRQLHANPPLQVRIEVREGGSPGCPPAPVLRLQRNLFSIVADAYNHAVCDLTQDFSLVWLNYAALQHRKYLCYHFIESAAWLLITTCHTTAIHAACVSRYGHGMLLSGDSGAGKSSLAYACAKAGWVYTSDDGSFLLHGGHEPRVVGNCRQIRFRPSAKELFPELQGRVLTPRVQGKPSIEVPTSELRLITAEQAIIHSIVFLNRQPSAVAELLPLPRGTAIRRFADFLTIDEIRDMQLANLQKLSSIEAYELRYRDLQPAIDRLDLLARGAGAPVV
jgi:hypothetical protein